MHSTGRRQLLNRIVRWVTPPYGSGREGIEYEADPLLAEWIIPQLGLSSSSRSVSTPSEKSKPGVDLGSLLNSADHTLHRSATMRLCYLASDRPDLQFPAEELASWMQAPTVGHLEARIRVARHLIGHGRWVHKLCDKSTNRLTLRCSRDSGIARCLKTRKSTSTSELFYGSHATYHQHLQGVIALSSGSVRSVTLL